jgi:hypothetical protein
LSVVAHDQQKFNWVEEQLHQEFSLDGSFPLGAPLFMETPHSCSMYAEKDDHCFDEVPTDPSQIVDLVLVLVLTTSVVVVPFTCLSFALRMLFLLS